jgi:hypothetical protein
MAIIKNVKVIAVSRTGSMGGVVVIEKMDTGSTFTITVQRGSPQHTGGAALITLLR